MKMSGVRYVVIERLTPLSEVQPRHSLICIALLVTQVQSSAVQVLDSVKFDNYQVAWGLQQLLEALHHMHQLGLAHGTVSTACVGITPGGDWKLGGLETVCEVPPAGTVVRVSGLPLGDPLIEVAPEVLRQDELFHAHGCDMWGLSRVLHDIFGGLDSPNFPKVLVEKAERMGSHLPDERPSADSVLQDCSSYFGNPYSQAQLVIQAWDRTPALEKKAFVCNLETLVTLT